MQRNRIFLNLGLLTLTGLVIATLLVYLTYDFGRRERHATLLDSARSYSAMMTAFRTFYSREIVSRLKEFDSNVEFSHNYKLETDTLPLPATMTLELSDYLSEHQNYPEFQMRSRFPFANRSKHTLSGFTERALHNIERSESQEYFEIADLADGTTQFSYAQAIYMEAECVACHNQHPLSTNRRWKVGDLRGIQQVSIKSESGPAIVLRRMTYLLAGFAIALLAVLGLAFRYFFENRKAIEKLRLKAQQSRQESVALQEATDRLFKVEGYLQDAIAALPDGFVLYDQNDRLVMCNDKYRELYKLSKDAIKPGMTFESIIRYGVEHGQYPAALEDPESWIERRMEFHYHPTSPIEQKLNDGTWLRVFEQQTERGQIVGFRVDITELKERERALAKSESQLRATLESSLDGIIVIDENGYIRDFSETAVGIFGYTREEAVGAYMSDLIIPVHLRDAHAKGMDHYRATGEGPVLGQRITVPALHKDGHEITIELAINPAQGKESEIFIAYVRDVTDALAQQKVLEDAKQAAEQAAEAKAAFLAIMSHEIRTPLNGLVGLLELIENQASDATTHKHAQSALDSALALTELLNSILDYSAIEERKITIKQSDFALAGFLEQTCALIQPITKKKGLKAEIELDPNLPDIIRSDEIRLRQMLLNLLGNAAKFSYVGKITLCVKQSEQKDKILFQVQDQGIGIAEKDIPYLFERFTTVDSSYNRQAGGSGLGLSITKSLVELMDGSIDVRSEEGKGSCFTIELPLIAAKTQQQDETPGKELIFSTMLYGLKVLVAEDNPANRLVLRTSLESFGMQVTDVENGSLALKAARTHDFDLVILDISMPVMDGLEAVRLFRQLPHYSACPIVAFTAYNQEEEKQEFLRSGFDAIVSKPARRTQVHQALVDVINKIELGQPADEEDKSVSADTDILDPDILETLMQDVPDDVKQQLAENCINDLKTNIRDMQDAFKDQQWDHVHRHAHILKGVTTTFGLVALSAPVKRISDLTRSEIDNATLNMLTSELNLVPELSKNSLSALEEILTKHGIFVPIDQ